MYIARPIYLALFCSVSLLWACHQSAPRWSKPELQQLFTLSPLPPLPANPTNRYADLPAARRLGEKLFFEPRLSMGNEQSTGTSTLRQAQRIAPLSDHGRFSCASCHDPQKGWSDGRPLSAGVAVLSRHAPTLWNVAYQRWQFWDGRADSLWAQALQPIEHPKEMGGSRHKIHQWMSQDIAWKRDYRAVFGAFPQAHDVNRFYTNLGKVLEAFERTMISRDAPFDQFVKTMRRIEPNDKHTLSPAAERGAKLFIGKARCILCHNGPNFSDGEFHNLGLSLQDPGRWQGIPKLKQDPFNGLGQFSDAPASAVNDKVRYVIQRRQNQGEFKTPTLRQVATTAPYMHDGRFQTLLEVVQFYNRMEPTDSLGKREDTLQPLHLAGKEEKDLVVFLESLTEVGAVSRK